MNLKFLGLVFIIGAGAYVYHHKDELMATDVPACASRAADNIAFAQGWIDDPFDNITTGVQAEDDGSPSFKIIKDTENNGVHTTTGIFKYYPVKNHVAKCKRMTFTWTDKVGSKEEKLLKQTNC